MDRRAGFRLHRRLAGKSARAGREGVQRNRADHADSLDHPAVPFRPADEPCLEGPDSALAGEHDRRHDGAAIRVAHLVAGPDFHWLVYRRRRH